MGELLRVGRPSFSDRDIRQISSCIGKVLRSGWLTNGRVALEFEEAFRRKLGVRFAVSTNSCTAAIHTLMCVLGVGPGDEVVVPANTFASTANAALYVGAKPVLADCDPDTFNVTAESIGSVITDRTRAVIPVHIGGNPCEMRDIVKLCRDRRIAVVEDCAHALGSVYRGKKCGTFGVASAFSFYPTKLITTSEGGMIATDLARVAGDARVFRNVGRASLGTAPITRLGFNYRMSEVHACIGLNQLSRLAQFIKRRRALAVHYHELLARVPWVEPQSVADHSSSTYYAYICKLSSKAPLSRDKLQRKLRRKGIETTVMFKPVHRQPYLAKLLGASRCPNAVMVGNRTIVLPLHAGMGSSDVRFVVDQIRAS
jgi:perosamine synthetase